MDAIIVDNEPFAGAISSDFTILHLCKDVDKDPREIATEVVELRNKITSDSEKAPILINIEGRFDKSGNRQEQKGVDVLLWLRCKHKVINPIVLYSFQPNHALLKKKPEHLVINSEGCYFIQLPNDFGLLNRGLRGVKNLDRLRNYLRPAFNIDQFRHGEANWWGLYRLLDAHRFLQTKKRETITRQGTLLSKQVLARLDYLDTHIVRFLYHGVDDSVEFNFQEALSYRNMLRALNPTPRVLYIDDMANLGWSGLLQEIIYSAGNNDMFRIIIPQGGVESILADVQTAIHQIHPDCVLLDLRLLDEKGTVLDASTLSGAEVMKRLRCDYPSLPVIIFTASNKARTVRTLLELGCEYLWTKEGIDEPYSMKDSVASYYDLTKAIYEACTKFRDNTEKAIYVAQVKLSELEMKIGALSSNLRSIQEYDIILTDTNIWLNRSPATVHLPLAVLMNYCRSKGHPRFVVIDHVFDEIIRIGKEKLGTDFYYRSGKKVPAKHRDKTRKLARWTESLLQRYYDQGLVTKHTSVVNTSHSSGNEKYNKKSYADQYFLKAIIPSLVADGARVLFISDDNGSKQEIREALQTQQVNGSFEEWTSQTLISKVAPGYDPK